MDYATVPSERQEKLEKKWIYISARENHINVHLVKYNFETTIARLVGFFLCFGCTKINQTQII